MAPIRRYLRITKRSVLECRIYVDNPALAESWLLNSRNPVLPRVIESVRPIVLPKLREEEERGRVKGGKKKKKSVKDVVVEEDFEVAVFLTDASERHFPLTKHKHFKDTNKKDLQSNSSKLTGSTNDTAIEVEDAPAILRESDEDALNLHDLPSGEDSLFVPDDEGPRRSKRPRSTVMDLESPQESSPGFEPLPKRIREADRTSEKEPADDKKKMAMDTSYDGFDIYRRVLCLVVKRIDKKGKVPATAAGGQAIMEDWIISTQMPPPEEIDDS